METQLNKWFGVQNLLHLKEDTQSHEYFMRRAIELARLAQEADEVPVGAVLVLDGEIVGEGFNQPLSTNDPTAHAEMAAIRAAAQSLGNYRLPGTTLYVTIEPCSMCAGAMVHARVQRLVYGAPELKAGVANSQGSFFSDGYLNHRVDVVGGVLAQECAELMRNFFQQRRQSK